MNMMLTSGEVINTISSHRRKYSIKRIHLIANQGYKVQLTIDKHLD